MEQNRNNGAFNNRHDNYRANNDAQEVRIDITEEVVTKKGFMNAIWTAIKSNKKVVIIGGCVVAVSTLLIVFRKKIKALFKKGDVTVEEIKEAVEEAQAAAEACNGKKK